MTIKVGITGGIGAGKTTVSQVFEALGVPVYYADDRAKAILSQNTDLKSELLHHFGSEIFDEQGRPDRKKLAAVVFNDAKKLRILNSLIHPRVGEDWKNWIASREYDFLYIMKEAALLFETGSYKKLDYIICVSAPDKLRIKRVSLRDSVGIEEVKLRMRNQLSQELKISLSDFLIVNDEKRALVPQVIRVHQKLVNLSKRKKNE